MCRAVVLKVVDNVSEAERLHQLENQLDNEANGDTEEEVMETHRISLEEGATSVCLLCLVTPRCVQTVTQCLTLLRGWDRDKVFLFNSPRILQRGGQANKRRAWLTKLKEKIEKKAIRWKYSLKIVMIAHIGKSSCRTSRTPALKTGVIHKKLIKVHRF